MFRGDFRSDTNGDLTQGVSEGAQYFAQGVQGAVATLSDVVFTTNALKNGIPDEFTEMYYVGSDGGDIYLGTGLRPDTTAATRP